MWNIKKVTNKQIEQTKNKLIDTDKRTVAARREGGCVCGGGCKLGRGGQIYGNEGNETLVMSTQ